jgi:hypothetical protein
MPWDFISASFQTLVKKSDPVSVPPKQLDAVATSIEKEKQMPIEQIALEHRLNCGAESVKSFAQINGLNGHEDMNAWCEA